MNRYTLISFFLFFYIALTPDLKAQTPNAELLEQNTFISVKNKRISRLHSFEIRINNRDGEDYTEIQIPFSNLTQVSKVQAFIKDEDGNVVKKLSRKDIREHSSFPSFSFYEDQWVKEFTLRHNIYPYVIHYEFEEQENEFIHLAYWTPILDTDIPTTKSTLIVEIPKDYKINYKARNISSLKVDSTDSNYTYQWEAEYNGNIKDETFAPSIYDSLPSIVIVPENFKFEIDGSLKSWEEFGYWQYGLIKDITDLPDYEIKRIKALTNGIQDEEQIIKTLYNYLQDETRYVNISIETGGLKPYPASYVAGKRYGDCKALSNYFRALLKVVNIDSHYAKIFAGESIEKIDRSMPSQQSNHIITCIPLENDTLWVDCTSDNSFKYVGTFIQGREVFVINENRSFFTKTPALSPTEVLQERNIKFEYYSQSVTNAQFDVKYRGKQYEMLNQISNNYNENKRQKILREIIIEDSFEPTNITFQPPHRDSSNITIHYTAQSNDIYKTYGNDIIVKPLALNIPITETPDKRNFPVQIDYPIFQKDIQTYSIPSDYKVQNFPENITITSKFGSYSIASSQVGDSVKITKQFMLKRGNYPINEYNDLYDFLQKTLDAEHSTYITSTKIN